MRDVAGPRVEHAETHHDGTAPDERAVPDVLTGMSSVRPHRDRNQMDPRAVGVRLQTDPLRGGHELSHITLVKTKFRSLDLIKETCTVLGLDFREGQKTHAWYGQFVNDSATYGDRDIASFGKCEHAIRGTGYQPGDYEIGVVADKDGETLSLVFDSWGSGRKLVPAVKQIRQEYAAILTASRVKARLAPKGFTLTRSSVGSKIVFRAVRR